MTAVITGLMPVLWAHGTGPSVMQRIAAPMIGGMVTATVLTLVVIPVLYYTWRRQAAVAHGFVRASRMAFSVVQERFRSCSGNLYSSPRRRCGMSCPAIQGSW